MRARLLGRFALAALCAFVVGMPVALAGGGERGPVTRDAARPDGPGDFYVPVSRRKPGFGEFRPNGEGDALRLRRALGPPSSRALRFDGMVCLLRWRGLGVVAAFNSYGLENLQPPCRRGVFSDARLTDRRWHTATRIRPGSRLRKARRYGVYRCRTRGIHGKRFCPATGFVLGWHRSACSNSLIPNVIAHPRGRRVVSLLVYSHSCE